MLTLASGGLCADNTDQEFEEAFATRVTGVMTDYPSRLRAHIDQREAAVTPVMRHACDATGISHDSDT